MDQGQGQGGVHDGEFNNLPMGGQGTKRRRQTSLLRRFDLLWNDYRYIKTTAPKNRLTCSVFNAEANALLKNVMDAELPSSVVRRGGHIGSQAIITHVDHFRTVLARLDREGV